MITDSQRGEVTEVVNILQSVSITESMLRPTYHPQTAEMK